MDGKWYHRIPLIEKYGSHYAWGGKLLMWGFPLIMSLIVSDVAASTVENQFNVPEGGFVSDSTKLLTFFGVLGLFVGMQKVSEARGSKSTLVAFGVHNRKNHNK